MKRLLLLAFGVCLLANHPALAQANTDGSYTVPIYVSGTSFGPDKYTIYASVGSGTMQPYLFDTGSPNWFTTAVDGTIVGSGSFSFAENITYAYNIRASSIALGSATGQQITAAATINVAQITAITGQSGTTNPTTPNQLLGDNTYGDFGAGGYGTTMLATALSQINTGSLGIGYVVNVAGIGSGQGALTIGLSQATRDQFYNNPDAIIMTMSGSAGALIPTANGTILGFEKDQVADTLVTITGDADTVSQLVGSVFDTGGGPNSIVYDPAFAGLGGGTLTIEYNGKIILQESGTTPWGGSVIVDSDTTGGIRVNPGGLIYDQYQVMFNLTDHQVVLVPLPEPGAVGLLAAGALIFGGLVWKRRQAAIERRA